MNSFVTQIHTDDFKAGTNATHQERATSVERKDDNSSIVSPTNRQVDSTAGIKDGCWWILFKEKTAD
jgi:hypothetical protein